MLPKVIIDPMYLSDHHPISISLEFADVPTRPLTLRLYPSLLKDHTIVPEVNRLFLQYFCKNNSPDISPMMSREAHKCIIWGELIAISTKCRWEQQSYIKKLTARIHTLEKAHKYTQAAFSLPELIQARTDLLEKLAKKTKLNYILSQKIFSEYGNKSGKLLARALWSKKAATTVHSLTDSTGSKIVANKEIANLFV